MSFLSKIFSAEEPKQSPVEKSTSDSAKIAYLGRIGSNCPVCFAEQLQKNSWNGRVMSEHGDVDNLCNKHMAALQQRNEDIRTGKIVLDGMTEDGKDFFCHTWRVACNFLILEGLFRGAVDDEGKAYWRDVLNRWREYAVDQCNNYGEMNASSKSEEQARGQYRQEHWNDSYN